MRCVDWVLVGVVAAGLVLFAVSTGETVALELWPLAVAYDVALYIIVLVPLLGGFTLGGAAAWLAGRGRRRELRRRRRRIEALERELAATRSLLDDRAPATRPG